MAKTLRQEALQYDLSSLLLLQDKRSQNIQLFEQSIKNERSASMKENVAQTALEEKVTLYSAKLLKLSSEEFKLMEQDIPKLKSTQDKRKQNIINLQQAILDEQNSMDHEMQMILFLKDQNDGKN